MIFEQQIPMTPKGIDANRMAIEILFLMMLSLRFKSERPMTKSRLTFILQMWSNIMAKL